jgi:uncharacterized OB-fold protein
MLLQQPTSSQTEKEDFSIHSFFENLEGKGLIAGSICSVCGMKKIPPRPICPKCFSANLLKFTPPHEGKIIGYSEIHVSNDEFEKLIPYVVAIADFDGVRLPGVVSNADVRQMRVGHNVRIRIKESQDREWLGPLYRFELF